MNIRNSLHITSILAACIGMCCRAYGSELNNLDQKPTNPQDTTIYKQVNLEEVTIKASFKQTKGLQTDPISATIVTGLGLQNRNLNGMKDLGTLVPNLFCPDYGSKLTSPIFIRGIGSKINAPSVGLYIDGVPYFEKSAFDSEFLDIDHIEVLHGPQGTLYGRNTMGGIINVYTKSPLLYQGTSIKISEGTYNDFNVSASHHTMAGKRFGYSVSVQYDHGDGYFTNLYTGKKADRNDEASARIRLAYKPNEFLNVQFTSSLDWLDQNGYPYRVINADDKIEKVNYNRPSSYRRTISTTGLNLEYEKNNIAFDSQTSFQYLDDNQRVDQDFTINDTYFAVQKQTQKMLSQEFNIKSTSDSRYKWLFGIFGFWQGIDNFVQLDYIASNYSTLKNYDMPTWGIAAFHQSTFEVNKYISFIAGIRFDYEKANDTYVGIRRNTDGTELSLNQDFGSNMNFTQWTPKVALQYTFMTKKTVYVSASKGYKAGGFNTSFEIDEDRTFNPESSWNYELGAKLPFCDGIIHSEFSLFYIDWKNQQIYQPLPSGKGQMLKNAGHSYSTGLEASISASPLNGLVISANYGFTYAKFKKYQRNEKLDYSHNFLPLVPRHTLSLNIGYTKSLNNCFLDRASINASYIGTGKLYWTDDNANHHSYYGIFNANISVKKRFLTFMIWSKNLSNTNYYSYYFESTGNRYVQQGKPFTMGVSLIVNI